MNVMGIHAHMTIREVDAENCLSVMDKALDDLNHEGTHIDRLRATLRRVALILVNKGDVAC